MSTKRGDTPYFKIASIVLGPMFHISSNFFPISPNRKEKICVATHLTVYILLLCPVFFYLLVLRIQADEFLILPLKLRHFGRCWEHTARAFTFYGWINFARRNFATSNWDFRSVTGDILVYRYTDLKSPIYIPVFMKVIHILASFPLKFKTLPNSSLYIDKISCRKCLRTNAVCFKREIHWRWRMLHYKGFRYLTVYIKHFVL